MIESQPITILIADDSIIVRGIITRILSESSNFKVVGGAIDGQSAIRLAEELKPDFITLDINMPRKDGLAALPEILKVSPKTKVIIASSMTTKNATISMKALELGASECLHMPDAKHSDELKRFSRELINCIIALSGANPMLLNEAEKSKIVEPVAIAPIKVIPPKINSRLQALAIASSTGGPQALSTLFKLLNGKIPNVPIFITQHMPPSFTNILANNIASVSGVVCKEGVDGEIAKPAHIYVAPGDYHLTPIKEGENVIIKINQGPMENYCRPAVDPMMRALIKIYQHNMLMVTLTGMGHDGLAGARELAGVGGRIIVQDKETSVVWGMPKAIADANIAHAILPLEKIAEQIIVEFNMNQGAM